MLREVISGFFDDVGAGEIRREALSGRLHLKYTHGDEASLLTIGRKGTDRFDLNPVRPGPSDKELQIVRRALIESALWPIYKVYKGEMQFSGDWGWVEWRIVWNHQMSLDV